MEISAPQDEVVRLCQDLIRIDTTNYGPDGEGPGEREAADYVVEQLREVGYEPQLFESQPGRASVVLRIPGGDAMRLSGRRVRIEATLRSSRVQGSASLKMMYSRSGEGNSSGWVELPVAKDFKTVSFEYTVPKSPPGPFDFVAVWADPTGNGRGVDFKDVVVRTIE